MASRLKLDIIVDDHGGVRVLQNLAGAERTVTREAHAAGAALDTIGTFASRAAAAFTGFISAQVVMRGLSAAFTLAKEATFGLNATLETTQLQFATLMGSSDRARAHVAALFDFAKHTPFETGQIIEASRLLQNFGGDALNTMDSIRLLGDTSAATAAPIDQLSFWVGRLYAMLQGGQPFGEAAMRLQELAVLTPQTRQQMEALQKSGADAAAVFDVFTGSLARFDGGMTRMAGTWQGVTSTFMDSTRMILAKALEPLFAGVRDGLQLINRLMESDIVAQAATRVQAAMRQAFDREHLVQYGTTLIDVAGTTVRTLDVLQLSWNALQAGIAGVIKGTADLVTWWSGKLLALLQAIPGATLAFGDQIVQLATVFSHATAISAGFSSVLHDQEEDYRRNANALDQALGVLDRLRATIPSVVATMTTQTAVIEQQTGAVQRLTAAQLGFVQTQQATLASMGATGPSWAWGMEPIAPETLGVVSGAQGAPAGPAGAERGRVGSVSAAVSATAAGISAASGGIGIIPGTTPTGFTGVGGAPGAAGGGAYIPNKQKPVWGAGGFLGYESTFVPPAPPITVNIDAKGAIFETDAVLRRLADDVARKLAERYGQSVRF